MTRQERLKFCKTCQKRIFDFNKGILCGLTNEYADFENSCPDYQIDEKIESLESYKSEKKKVELEKIEKKKKIRQKRIRAKKKQREKEKIQKEDLLQIATFALVSVYVIRLLSYMEFSYTANISKWSGLITIFVSAILLEILRKDKEGRKAFRVSFKFKLLHAISFSIIFLIYTFLFERTERYIGYIFLIIFVASFVLSFISYAISIPISFLLKKNINLNIKVYRYILIFAFLSLAGLGILENDVFVKRQFIKWKPNETVRAENFQGYQNILSDYSAAIFTKFTYKILGNSYDSVEVETVMLPHHSWIKNSVTSNDLLLTHEQYHFNISEVYSRKFKKVLHNLKGSTFDEKIIDNLYNNLLFQTMVAQDKYDRDCLHGLDYERQKDWEYIVDSMLVDYAYYENTLPQRNQLYEKNKKYYRQIIVDGYNEIVGKYPLEEKLARNSLHYEFNYQNRNLTEIKYFDGTRPESDPYFNVAKIVLEKRSNNSKLWHFQNEQGVSIMNTDGVYSLHSEKKANHLIVSCIDNQGRPMKDRLGVSIRLWTLDASGRKSSSALYDENNKRIRDREGNIFVKHKYDRFGNIYEIANYDNTFRLSNKYQGYAYQRFLYDELDNPISIEYYNENHKKTCNEMGIATEIFRYDIHGNVVMKKRLNESNHPLTGKDIVVIAFYKYDEFGRRVELKNFGNNKNLIINENGFGCLQDTYDSLGRLYEQFNYDAYGHLLGDKHGSCKARYYYNEDDQLDKQVLYKIDSSGNFYASLTIACFYNEENELVKEIQTNHELENCSDPDQVYQIIFNYDWKRMLFESRNYNRQFELCANEDGIAIEKNILNAFHLREQVSYYDAEGNPYSGDEYREVVKWEYNDKGQMIYERYFNSDHQPVKNNYGVHAYYSTYSEQGDLLSETALDLNDRKVNESNSGICITEYLYNDNQQLTRITLKSAEGKTVECSDGYAIQNQYYDNKNNLVKIEFLNKFKQLVNTNEGYASEERMTDLNANVVATIYRDENGVLAKDSLGYAIYNRIYNRNGEMVSERVYPDNETFLDSINTGPFTQTVNAPDEFNNNTYRINNNTGLISSYYNSGQKESEAYYINGRIEGKYYHWYKSGQLSEEIDYSNGKRNGLSIKYYENGIMMTQSLYKDNKIIIESEVTWHENGQLKSKFINNKIQFWDPYGNPIVSN